VPAWLRVCLMTCLRLGTRIWELDFWNDDLLFELSAQYFEIETFKYKVCKMDCIALMTEAVRTSETSVNIFDYTAVHPRRL
jgi:hypothetical protein